MLCAQPCDDRDAQPFPLCATFGAALPACADQPNLYPLIHEPVRLELLRVCTQQEVRPEPKHVELSGSLAKVQVSQA